MLARERDEIFVAQQSWIGHEPVGRKIAPPIVPWEELMQIISLVVLMIVWRLQERFRQ